MKVTLALFIVALAMGCATKSKIPFSAAPQPADGYGLVYILNEGPASALNNISSIHLDPLNADDKTPGTTVFLIAGEYTWLHVKAGKYKAAYRYPANGQLISVSVNIENGKTHYINLTFSNDNYVTIDNVSEATASKKIFDFKYFEYKDKDCTLVINCR